MRLFIDGIINIKARKGDPYVVVADAMNSHYRWYNYNLLVVVLEYYHEKFTK